MHPQLERQLREAEVDASSLPRELLERIARTYAEADRDRLTLERALWISSGEMQTLYEELRSSSAKEIREKNEALERSLALATAIREAVPDGILVVDTVGSVLAMNGRLLDLWSLPGEVVDAREDLRLRQWMRTLLQDPETFESQVRRYYDDTRATGRDELRLRDGRIFDRYTAPVCSDEGVQYGRVWCFRDVTQERRLELERSVLAERMASVGRVAASVAHEINNPLCYVTNTLETLRAEVAASSDAASLVGEALGGLDRIARIVSDLGSLTRPSTEQAPVDLVAVIEKAIAITGNQIRHRARLVRRFDRAARVLGDDVRLEQLFMNLLVNAAQAIPEGAGEDHEIAVEVAVLHGRVRASVRDTGVGIAPELAERIFDPFFTTKSVNGGTGLGLAICRSIVRAHGGEIHVESEPGRGSTFVVELPVHAAERTSVRVAKEATAAAARSRILLVDDDVALRRSLLRVLRRHEVVECGDVDAALAALERDRFDVILCDVMMPDRSGIDFHDAVAERHPELRDRIVFLTGGAFSERASAFLATCSNALLQKPFRSAELEATIAGVIAAHAAPAARFVAAR